MPSSRASSPLSSALSSPRLAGAQIVGPEQSGSFSRSSSIASAPTSPTEVLTDEEMYDQDESELTEDDGGGEDHDESKAHPGDSEDSTDDMGQSPTTELPNNQHPLPHSPSLTPPPPASNRLVAATLPTSPAPGQNLDTSSLTEVVEDGQSEEELVDEEEEDGDGDITMRPPDNQEDVEEEEEAAKMEAAEQKATALGVAKMLVDFEAAVVVNRPELDIPAVEVEAEVTSDAGEKTDGEGLVQDGGEDTGVEAEIEEEAVTAKTRSTGHAHSSHAPPPTPAMMKELLRLEIKLAALRDKLYVERMEETVAEEEMILKGTHPALSQMHDILSHRRQRLHQVSVVKRRAVLSELEKMRETDRNMTWTWWTIERDQLHWNEFEQTWSKRRRLQREKNEIDTVHLSRPVPRPGDPSRRSLDWAAGPIPSSLTTEEALADLHLMEARRTAGPSRVTSPAVFAPASNHSQQSYYQTQTYEEEPRRHHHHHVFAPPRQPHVSASTNISTTTSHTLPTSTVPAQPRTVQTYMARQEESKMGSGIQPRRENGDGVGVGSLAAEVFKIKEELKGTPSLGSGRLNVTTSTSGGIFDISNISSGPAIGGSIAAEGTSRNTGSGSGSGSGGTAVIGTGIEGSSGIMGSSSIGTVGSKGSIGLTGRTSIGTALWQHDKNGSYPTTITSSSQSIKSARTSLPVPGEKGIQAIGNYSSTSPTRPIVSTISSVSVPVSPVPPIIITPLRTDTSPLNTNNSTPLLKTSIIDTSTPDVNINTISTDITNTEIIPSPIPIPVPSSIAPSLLDKPSNIPNPPVETIPPAPSHLTGLDKGMINLIPDEAPIPSVGIGQTGGMAPNSLTVNGPPSLLKSERDDAEMVGETFGSEGMRS
ncbi:hypothetical protein M231_07141 [Tremella mesenterica]|uniref:Uncharacterized protein n=1 Tax=Tremella mesenterica TaxID=5217 RepID=A0A4Q1BFU7_TREME|nr:uncharacterized protein TREMEDRAFT_64879 [Tremella mesenterica DSM 1558]EIW67012.1 hypothetical protein TREMEDRAFT_64879 [Tremella mesenterica DSM 1558]RXK35611.1 hypothetical protein M231_07141 [Tremella mesenterica]